MSLFNRICNSGRALALLMLFGIPASAEDWPQFLGPRADGTSTETNLLDKWPEQGPPLVWEKDVGTGYGAPSVRDNKLVLHHRVKDQEVVECWDAKTGAPIWDFRYPSDYVDLYGYNNGPRCSPLLTANRCYTFGAEGKLYCLDLQTGKKVWERDTAKDWQIPQPFFGVGSTPILEGDILIVMVGGQPDSGMVGFEAATGKTVWESVGEKNWQGQPMVGWPGERTVQWQRWEKQASYSTPVAATVNGERQVFCLMRQGLVSVNPKTGEVNFSFWFRSQLNDSVNAANPVVIGDTVLISGAYYKVGSVLLKVLPGNKKVEEIWRGTSLEIHWNTPIVHEGRVYAFSGRNEPDAHFRCVEHKTGKLLWDRDERWRGHAPIAPTYGRGSAVMAEGKLIVLGEGGILGLFKVDPTAPVELARHQIPQLHYPCWAAPVLSNRLLYLRSENKLVCLNIGK